MPTITVLILGFSSCLWRNFWCLTLIAWQSFPIFFLFNQIVECRFSEKKTRLSRFVGHNLGGADNIGRHLGSSGVESIQATLLLVLEFPLLFFLFCTHLNFRSIVSSEVSPAKGAHPIIHAGLLLSQN